ncbi:hypothetical protein KOR34_21060 [Posidoniimonas corsicana]|uniref:Methylamine utilisation protein MauE domain-containing protein n=1 Tax=Posidoniimonas corsicana TaxID=1938618 RepID=A0A5C5VGX3_9BACT|nr:hypothetical protein KOR34_21060 [Posidoniimonas corsicana]
MGVGIAIPDYTSLQKRAANSGLSEVLVMPEFAASNPIKVFANESSSAWATARVAVGILLITSAFVKATSPGESALLESAYSVPQWAILLAVQAETALGIALLWYAWPRQSRRATQTVLLVFSAFFAYRVLGGAESCGCFGLIKVTPWWSVGLNVVVLGALTLVRPETEFRRPRAMRVAFARYVALGGPCLALVAPSGAQAIPLLKDVGGMTLPEPKKWTGQPFPLSGFLEPS